MYLLKKKLQVVCPLTKKKERNGIHQLTIRGATSNNPPRKGVRMTYETLKVFDEVKGVTTYIPTPRGGRISRER